MIKNQTFPIEISRIYFYNFSGISITHSKKKYIPNHFKQKNIQNVYPRQTGRSARMLHGQYGGLHRGVCQEVYAGDLSGSGDASSDGDVRSQAND